MNRNSHTPLDLAVRAREAMLDAGFEPDLPSAAQQELRSLSPQADPPQNGALRDLRPLLWSSIDNEDSRDLDQVEYAETAEGGGIRVMVAVADVDGLVREASALDDHAGRNTTSVYTGVVTFPMLPEELSTDLTSLNQAADRLSVVTDMTVTPGGSVSSYEIYRALVRNHAKLDYESVGAWLDDQAPIPDEVDGVPGLKEQLKLQDEAAKRMHAYRKECGALDFETVEANPVVKDGQVVDMALLHKNPARYIIENFMIGANMSMASFLEATGQPSIQRVVRTPERWDRIVAVARGYGATLPGEPDALALSRFLAARRAADPEHFPDLSLCIIKLLGPGEYAVLRKAAESDGHFGLAAHRYTHSTAPNRRYVDLITQRLLKAVLAKAPPPYASGQLTEICERCTEREHAAQKVERLMRKVAAATLLSGRIGDEFRAIVIGASPKGTYVRLVSPPVEGRVMRGERGMDVGDHVYVRLTHTDPQRGFIDFERAG